MRCLVSIPSIRNPAVISEYARNAELHKFDLRDAFFLMITEDSADKASYKRELGAAGLDGEVMGAAEREAFMRENGIIEYLDLIPKRSHAETSFGLIYQWLNKKFEYGFFIDDDTSPIDHIDYFGSHLSNLNFSGEVDSVSSDKGWVNVLHQTFEEHRLYPRGYPYSKMNEKNSIGKANVPEGKVLISQGLWTNVPDLDAIRILMDGDLNGQAKTRLAERHFRGNFVAEKGNFQTVCSMNLSFRREIIPAFYQFPMDDNPYKIGRFDDIWSGLVAKAVADRAGGYIMNGYPLCTHNKAARSTFKDVALESPGYESNEFFSETVGNAQPREGSAIEVSRGIAQELSIRGKTDFTRYCGEHLGRWVDLCEETQ
jgi:hypothetical protein